MAAGDRARKRNAPLPWERAVAGDDGLDEAGE
jgi:hypothetical protein